jgi:membrane protease YdiL (CAAX protease family)
MSPIWTGHDPKRVVDFEGVEKDKAPMAEAPRADQSQDPSTNVLEAATSLPDRYVIKETAKARVLTCTEAPTLSVRLERGYVVTAAAAHRAAPGTIYLDGVAQAEPFIDAEKQVYNLDHHVGCVRAFTLATCEQAMVMVRRRLNLRERDWTVFANEPDLDTILAVWVLLNHIQLNDEDPEIRSKVIPLLRLQGTIDALGLEMLEMSGLAGEEQKSVLARVEELRRHELALKKDGRWQEIDFLKYTSDILRSVDAMVYSTHHFEGSLNADVKELARAEVAERWLAVACASDAGIYEVERHLRRLYGDRLGIVILHKDPQTYTLRKVDPSLPLSLDRVYDQLNLLDQAVGSFRSENRWGGSDEIGGSPRATGTRLTAEEITDICGKAYRRPSQSQQAGALLEALVASAVTAVSAVIVLLMHGSWQPGFAPIAGILQDRSWQLAAVVGLLSLVLLILKARSAPRLFGFRLPSGIDWLIMLPFALLSSLVGGARFPAALTGGQGHLLGLTWGQALLALVFAGSAELLFRGLVQGILSQGFPRSKHQGSWLLSWPVAFPALLYVLWAGFPYIGYAWPGSLYVLSGVLLLALVCGLARQRSHSLLPPLLLHWLALLVPALPYFGR